MTNFFLKLPLNDNKTTMIFVDEAVFEDHFSDNLVGCDWKNIPQIVQNTLIQVATQLQGKERLQIIKNKTQMIDDSKEYCVTICSSDLSSAVRT